ncbi:MAG: hypothetical protein R3206_02345, partial [Salegentibacter mishustinae]|nr:hypothetical protein [Salegentibacter mishustinae]
MNFKKLSFLFFVCAFFTLSSSTAQDKELYRELYNSYENFKEESIEKRRFTQTKIQPLIDDFNQKENFKV